MVNVSPSPFVSIEQTTIIPGIYDISNETYHQGHGISRSALMEFKRSPYHYWYKYLNPYYVPESATPAQIFGNALHTFILEPKEFEKQFFTLDKFDKRTKAGAERWKQIQAEQGIKTFLKEAQYQELQQMAESLQKNKLALQLIENAQIEQYQYHSVQRQLLSFENRWVNTLNWFLPIKESRLSNVVQERGVML